MISGSNNDAEPETVRDETWILDSSINYPYNADFMYSHHAFSSGLVRITGSEILNEI